MVMAPAPVLALLPLAQSGVVPVIPVPFPQPFSIGMFFPFGPVVIVPMSAVIISMMFVSIVVAVVIAVLSDGSARDQQRAGHKYRTQVLGKNFHDSPFYEFA